MRKGRPEVIADAGRHRRTPWTLAVESKAIKGMTSAYIGGTGDFFFQKACQNHQQITEMAPLIHFKSMRKQGCARGLGMENSFDEGV